MKRPTLNHLLEKPKDHWPEAVFLFFILVAMLLAPGFEINPRTQKFQETDWGVISGDEPHYLITVNSLIKDGDLDLRNNYENLRRGGLDAGKRFRGGRLDHHTYVIDKSSGERWLWQSIYDYTKRRRCGRNAPDHECYQKKRDARIDHENAVEVSAHPLAFALILTASVAPFFPTEDQIETYCARALVVYSWLTLVLLYAVCRRLGLSRLWAAGCISLLCFASPWFVYSRTFFAENICGTFLMAALLSQQSRKTALTGVFLSLAMALKPAFVVVGFAWIALLIFKRQLKRAFRLALIMGALGIILSAFNYWLAGTIFVAGAAEWLPWESLGELHIELTDSKHGLFMFVPWTIFVFWTLIQSFEKSWKSGPGFELLVALPTLLYYVVITAHGGLSGYCYGPRYWVPLLPFYTLVFARGIAELSAITSKIIIGLTVAASALVAISAILYFRFIWSAPYEISIRLLSAYLGFHRV